MLNKFFNDPTGIIIVSILLGLGLASLFRRACKNNCIILKGPDQNEIINNIYNFDDKCYKFKTRMVKCTNDKKINIKEK